MHVLREPDYVTVPWKNGGGLTREILKVPAGATAFDWRLSLASITAPGPFSAFDGYDRTLVLVRGDGVELDFGPRGQTTLRAPGESLDFDGSWPAHCTLLGDPSTDLNLIVSRTRAEAQTRILRPAAPELIRTTGWEETLVCCISGSAQIENATGEVATLHALDVARCGPGDGVITCGPLGPDPVVLLVAAVRHRPAAV
jgi:environmental stress-induced protein Ves